MAEEMVEVELASRLTLKDLGCDAKDAVKKLPEGQHKIAIARFYGLVSKVTPQEDRMGSGQVYTMFTGNFEGVNLQDGTVLKSGRMFLPDGASQALEHIVSQVQNKPGGKNASVQFAFEIRAVKNPDNKTGYSYDTAAILKPEEADQLSALRATVASAPKPKGLAEVPPANNTESKTPARKTA